MNDSRVDGNAPAPTVSDPLSDELLRSVVDVARAFFGAAASSVFLLDEAHDELVFQAVSGAGEEHLVGRRFPARGGVAGWVVMSGESVIVDDLTHSAHFDRDFAESTEYVPDSLMAAPLTHGDRVLGVLEVLDPVPQSRSSLDELDLLELFARQAAVALRVVTDRRRQADGPVLGSDDRAAALRMAEDLRRLLQATI